MPDYRALRDVPTLQELSAAVELVLEMARTLYVHRLTTRAVGEALRDQLERMFERYSDLHAEARETRADQEAYRQAVGVDTDEERR